MQPPMAAAVRDAADAAAQADWWEYRCLAAEMRHRGNHDSADWWKSAGRFSDN